MLSFASAPGNLMNRIGKLGALTKNVRTHQLIQLPAMIDTTAGVVAQFAGESDIQALMGSSYLGVLSGVEGVAAVASNIGYQTLTRMVYRDNPLIAMNLQSLNTLVALNEIFRQMRAEGATVLRMNVGCTPGAFAGQGNGVLYASLTRPFDGLPLENAYAESIVFTCTQDSYTGGATAGNEGFAVAGAGNESDPFAFDWPLGSNAAGSLQAISAAGNNSLGNLLQNSNFATFLNTPDIPDNWNLAVGTAGVNVFQETGLVYDGAGAVKIVGDGATLVSLTQQFGDSGGTSATLSPQTQYSFNIFLRRDGTAAGQGQLTADLVDGGNNVISDANGAPNSVTFDLTALTVNYLAYGGAFRTPHILPAQVFLRLHMPAGQALSAGRAVYLDYASLGIHQQLYVSGPFFAIHSGSVPFVASPVPDFATAQVTNSRGAGGTLSTFQTLWAQLFTEMISQELLIPSSPTPSISDLLIG